MSSDRSIQEVVRKLAGTQFKSQMNISVCEVTAINTDDYSCSCTPIDESSNTSLEGVRLMATVDDGFLMIPVIGSTIVVAYSDDTTDPYVIMMSEIDEVFATQNKWTFNDGSFGGLIKIREIVQKINNIENLLNHLIGRYNTHTHPISGAVANQTAMQETGLITSVTKVDELENKNVIHG